MQYITKNKNGNTLKIDFVKEIPVHFGEFKMEGVVRIDSLENIGSNKVLTVFGRKDAKDFIDLYFILQKDKKLSLDDLIKKTQIKFDNYLDPIQLGAQYMKVKELKDYPKMLINFKNEVWQDFFINEAKKLSSIIIN